MVPMMTNANAAAYDTTPVVRSRENADGAYEVYIIATGEVLSTFDSRHLARRSVSVQNRSIIANRARMAAELAGY